MLTTNKNRKRLKYKIMRQLLTILIITLAPLTIFGQSKTLKVSVFFDIDKFVLRADAKQTIDSTLESLILLDIYKINVSGNTDNTADSLYNLKLSNNRTEQVKNYLNEKGINSDIIKKTYFGENKPIANNNTEEGKQNNRRVDIAFFYKQKTAQIETKVDSIPKEILAIDTCKKDTVIILPGGTQVVFNLCEYLEIKDCLEFTETNNSDAILANGISLMDTSGIPIASCGMLRITMKPGCTERECFKIPIKVRFPVPNDKDCDYCGRNARVWDISSNGGWIEGQGKKNDVKIIKAKGQLFYQFEIVCPNYWKNCDCKLPKGKKIKFKTKRKYKIVRVVVTSNCPTTAIEFKPMRRENIANKRIPCLIGDKNVVATIIDKNGDTLTLEQMPLNDLTKRTIFSGCKKIKGVNIGHRFGIFPIGKRSFYRKYIIKPSDLKPKQ
jgi:outer membrane protein OmpA-like peptidoglycan-associated protein